MAVASIIALAPLLILCVALWTVLSRTTERLAQEKYTAESRAARIDNLRVELQDAREDLRVSRGRIAELEVIVKENRSLRDASLKQRCRDCWQWNAIGAKWCRRCGKALGGMVKKRGKAKR